MEIKSGVYSITNLVNKKVYIGQSNNIYRRWINHKNKLENNKHHNKYLQNSWNKYGKEKFEFSILQLCKSKKEMNYWETFWYDYYCKILSNKNVFNLAHTGNSHNTSKELREKRRIFMKSHPNGGQFKKGKKYSDEEKEKMSKSSTRKRSVAQFDGSGNFIKRYESLAEAEKETGILSQNISRCCKGKTNHSGRFIWRYINENVPLSIEIDDKKKQIILGYLHHNSGRKATEETKEKLRKSHIGKSPLIKKINQYDLNGNFIKQWSGRYAIKLAFHKEVSHIVQVCNGQRKSAYGYKWSWGEL